MADADAIVHMTEIPSLFYAAFKEMGMSIDTGKTWLRDKIKRDWDKMSNKSKKLYEKKYRAVMEILTPTVEKPEDSSAKGEAVIGCCDPLG